MPGRPPRHTPKPTLRQRPRRGVLTSLWIRRPLVPAETRLPHDPLSEPMGLSTRSAWPCCASKQEFLDVVGCIAYAHMLSMHVVFAITAPPSQAIACNKRGVCERCECQLSSHCTVNSIACFDVLCLGFGRSARHCQTQRSLIITPLAFGVSLGAPHAALRPASV